jgi:hypothetical protein
MIWPKANALRPILNLCEVKADNYDIPRSVTIWQLISKGGSVVEPEGPSTLSQKLIYLTYTSPLIMSTQSLSLKNELPFHQHVICSVFLGKNCIPLI